VGFSLVHWGYFNVTRFPSERAREASFSLAAESSWTLSLGRVLWMSPSRVGISL
jgi:hypothetical protein